MEQMTAVTAQSEVRKILRFFDSLKRLEEVLELVAVEEKARDKLLAEKAQLAKTLSDSQASLERLQETLESVEQKTKALGESYKARVKELQDEERTITSSTQQKLETMKQAAAAQVELARMELGRLQPQVADLRQEKEKLEQSIATLKSRAALEMEEMFSAVKKLSK